MEGRKRGILTTICLTVSTLAMVGVAQVGGVATARPAAPVAAYVVVLRDSAPGAGALSVPALARALVAPLGGSVGLTYDHALRGFAVTLPAAAVPLLRADPRVASISPDVVLTAAETQRRPTWNLDRIDQTGRRLNGTYDYLKRAGAGAHIYVVDTGLSGHPDLTGRIGAGRNFSGSLLFDPDPARWGDCEGHGTHVASTAAGTRWGVAKRATVHAVRVLDCAGSGSTSEIVAGLDWVAAHHQSPAVVNMSLSSSSRVPAIDAAARGLVSSGVAVAVAAGNSNRSACTESPAGEPDVVTVAATNRSDNRPGFSNYGACVDIFAPGVDVIAAKLGSAGGVSHNGTSMSSPHVAGALALIRADQPQLSARAAQERLLDGASRGVVGHAGPGSPNRLLRVFADRPPTATFRVSCDGLRCTFRADGSSDDEGVRGFRWQFGKDSARGPVVTHVYRGQGPKKVVLTVVDVSGQRDTAQRKFRLKRKSAPLH